MNILYETDKLKLGHEYETVFLIEKPGKRTLLEDDFYGDPTWKLFGTIGPGQTISLLVEWPTNDATVFNNSVANSSIYVFGNGIFPITSGEE